MTNVCRYDIYSKVGLQPSRASASTQAVSSSNSNTMGSLVRSGQAVGATECGQEQEGGIRTDEKKHMDLLTIIQIY